MFVRNIAGSSNGRTAAFGAAYLGSNPSPAALLRSTHQVFDSESFRLDEVSDRIFARRRH